jgi:hypothetical protein
MPDERLVAAVVDEGWWLNMPQRNTKTVEGITQEWDGTLSYCNYWNADPTNLILPARLFGIGVPRPGWMIEQLWPEGSSGFLAGFEKTDKSWIAADAALALASGTALAGRMVTRSYRTLLLSEELPVRNLVKRLDMLARGREIDWRKLPLFLGSDTGLRLDSQNCQEAITAYIRAYEVDFVIFDPLSRLFDGDENSAADCRRVLRYLDTLRRTFGVAVLVVHHDKKVSKDQKGKPRATSDADALRGSGDLRAWWSTLWHVQKIGGGLVLKVSHRNAPALDAMQMGVGYSGNTCPVDQGGCGYVDNDDTQYACPKCGGRVESTTAWLTLSGGTPKRKDSTLAARVIECLRQSPNGMTVGALRSATDRNDVDILATLSSLVEENIVGTIGGKPVGTPFVRYRLTATIASAMADRG